MIAGIAWTVALVSTAHGARRSAIWLVNKLELGPFAPGALTGAIFVSGLMVSFALAARAVRSVDAGLIGAALFGVALCVLAWRGPPLPVPRPERALWIRFALTTAALLALYLFIARMYQIHDEHSLFGHKSMVEQLRRGAYPLYFAPFPAEEARYHYGFDLLAGAFARAYGLSSDNAIDLVTVALAGLMCVGAAAVVADLGDRRSASFAAIAIHLGGGLAFPLLLGTDGRHPRCLAQYHHPSCGVELFPAQFLNVFQHPVSAGVPLFLALVLVLPRLGLPQLMPWRSRTFWGVIGLSVLLLSGAAIGQFVYFALSILAALAAWPIWSRGERGKWGRPNGVLAPLLALVFALVIAKAMGGMLAPNDSIDPTLLGFRRTPGYPDHQGPFGILYAYVINLGIGFVALPLIAWIVLKDKKPGAVMLLAFACGGALVPQLFVYSRSWDIVKFPSAASFALAMLVLIVIDRFFWAVPSPLRHVRCVVLALLIGTGVASAWLVAKPLPGDLRLYDTAHWEGDPIVRQTIDWLRSHDYNSRDVVLAQGNVAKELSVFGGLSVVAEDTDLYYVGIKQQVLDRQRRLSERARATLEPEALGELGVRWLIFSDEELNGLGPSARAKLLDPAGPAVELASFPGEREGRRRRIWWLR